MNDVAAIACTIASVQCVQRLFGYDVEMQTLWFHVEDLPPEVIENLSDDIVQQFKDGVIHKIPKDAFDLLPDRAQNLVPAGLVETNPKFALVLAAIGVLGVIGLVYSIVKSTIKIAVLSGVVGFGAWYFFFQSQ